MEEKNQGAPDGASAAPPPNTGFPAEPARKKCEKRQAECPHEWALSTQRNGLLVWRFNQDDCPRCLKMWMDYWRSRAKSAEAVKTIVRRCRCPYLCEVHPEVSAANASKTHPEAVDSEALEARAAAQGEEK